MSAGALPADSGVAEQSGFVRICHSGRERRVLELTIRYDFLFGGPIEEIMRGLSRSVTFLRSAFQWLQGMLASMPS